MPSETTGGILGSWEWGLPCNRYSHTTSRINTRRLERTVIGMNQKKEEENGQARNGVLGVLIVVGGFWLLWGQPWWDAYGHIVRLVVWWAALAVVLAWLGLVVSAVRCWWVGRSGRVSGERAGSGGVLAGRVVLWLVPVRGGGGRSGPGPGPGVRRGNPDAAEAAFWSWVLRHVGGLVSGSGRVVRVVWAFFEGELVWGLSVDRELARSVERAVGDVWPGHRIEPWPLHDEVEVSDGVPLGEGGGAVVRRVLAPGVLSRPLHRPGASPDHPMALIGDIAADHPQVDVRLIVDVVALSPSERARVCEQRLKGLGEYDPDRLLWAADDARAGVEGVGVLLRVSRQGPGHAAECQQVADRICRLLSTFWATDYNRLTVQKVSDRRFDAMWTGGAVGRDMLAFHWDCMAVLLAPPPAGVGRSASSKRLADPPVLETFCPQEPGGLMPIGAVSDNGAERMVGVPLGGPAEPGVDWTVGATGSGKTWHALARAIPVAESGRGVLFVDPHRAGGGVFKQFLAAGHADRILEIDLQATDSAGEPVSAGWNPLDLTVVPEKMRRARIDTLKGVLGVALFPDYFGSASKAPQTSTILRKTLECLLNLNYHLPAQIQANVYCIEDLLLDDQWRALAVARLPARDQKWWRHTYPMIVGAKGATSVALKPALNALELWKTQKRIQALLGASESTLRFRDIIDEGKILFLTLNDGSETDNLLARLIVGEMIAAFKERSLTHRPGQPVRPFHLFLDEFQAYSSVLEAHAQVVVQELRKFGAKVHFINQSPSALSPKTKDMILANRTHLFAGKLGNLKDADNIAKAMGGQPRTRPTDNNQRGPAPIEGRDLLGMPSRHFICQVTHNGETSAPFEVKGIDVEQAWKHLKTDRDISQQIAANTGLVSVQQRLDHYDALPERIAHWLQTSQPPTSPPATQEQQRITGPPATAGAVAGSYSNSPITDPQQVASIHQWAENCIIEDPQAVTPTNQFTVSYTQWCQQNSVQPLPVRELQQHLTHQHGPSQTVRIEGKVTRVRKGIKPRTPDQL